VERVLPALLRAWAPYTPTPATTTILVATGIHRKPTAAEMDLILGADLAQRLAACVRFHDPDDPAGLSPIGQTPSGHVVNINKLAVAADRLVLIGAASFHYHAGFGGGRKLLVPGVADRATIAHTHSLALDPLRSDLRSGVEIGRLDGNPVAEELMRAASLPPPRLPATGFRVTRRCTMLTGPSVRAVSLFCSPLARRGLETSGSATGYGSATRTRSQRSCAGPWK
jgi:nickel-dependent lactate racemase